MLRRKDGACKGKSDASLHVCLVASVLHTGVLKRFSTYPAQVKVLTGNSPCGPEVSVEMEEGMPMFLLKARLETLTGRWPLY